MTDVTNILGRIEQGDTTEPSAEQPLNTPSKQVTYSPT
jgi:hypothetical protein